MSMNLQHHFLIAMPQLEDARFERSVIYICEHNSQGAMGLMINKPIDGLNIGLLLDKLNESEPLYSQDNTLNTKPVFHGGPLADDRGFVVHTPYFGKIGLNASIQVADNLIITTSKDILSTLGTVQQPSNIMVALGYAGWQPGQLEQELSDNSWLTVEADNQILFDTPIEQRWQQAAKKLGVDIYSLSSQIGHA